MNQPSDNYMAEMLIKGLGSQFGGEGSTTGGERVAFAFLMNRVSPSGARVLQDRMTVALARYDAAN
jgi:D-alanyl-D-alanine carboxypeptidase